MNAPDPSPLEREIASHCLASRLRLLNRMVTNLYDEALRPHGLRISQANILVAIAVSGPVPGVDLCRRLRLEKSTLSRDLTHLFRRGWIAATAGKGRAQLLRITPQGRDFLKRAAPAWREAQRRARKLLTPELADGILGRVSDLWKEDASAD